MSWAPFLPLVGAWVFLGLPGWAFGIGTLALVGGLAWYWRSRMRALEDELVKELVEESNAKQDRLLEEKAQYFRSKGAIHFADCLRETLRWKQRIEGALQQELGGGPGAAPLGRVADLERLVDEIAFGIYDQVDRLDEMELALQRTSYPISESERLSIEESRKAIVSQIGHAVKSLESTWNRLGEILRPVGTGNQHGVEAEHAGLASAISQLEEEKKLAERVRERMESEWQAAFSHDPIAVGDAGSGQVESAGRRSAEPPHSS